MPFSPSSASKKNWHNFWQDDMTGWLSFKTLIFLSVGLSSDYAEDLRLSFNGRWHILDSVWLFCVCIYIHIYVRTGRGAKGTLIIDCWLSVFESLSYNRDDNANQTARGHIQSLVSDFTYMLLIAGNSKAIPGKESLYTCPVSHIICLKI